MVGDHSSIVCITVELRKANGTQVKHEKKGLSEISNGSHDGCRRISFEKSGSLTKWISGEFMFNLFGCCAFETSQISPIGASPLPMAKVAQSRKQRDTIMRR